MWYAIAFYWVIAGLWAWGNDPHDEFSRRYPIWGTFIYMVFGGVALPVAIINRILK